MNLRSVIPASIALFPGADILIKVLPVPVDYSVYVKLPAALFCLIAAYIVSSRKLKCNPIPYCVGAAIVLTAYVGLSTVLLHSNPVYYRPGDNSLVGMWVSERGKVLMEQNDWSRLALQDGFSPSEWTILYSPMSQLASATLLAVLYACGFAGLTLGIGMFLQRKAQPA